MSYEESSKIKILAQFYKKRSLVLCMGSLQDYLIEHLPATLYTPPPGLQLTFEFAHPDPFPFIGNGVVTKRGELLEMRVDTPSACELQVDPALLDSTIRRIIREYYHELGYDCSQRESSANDLHFLGHRGRARVSFLRSKKKERLKVSETGYT